MATPSQQQPGRLMLPVRQATNNPADECGGMFYEEEKDDTCFPDCSTPWICDPWQPTAASHKSIAYRQGPMTASRSTIGEDHSTDPYSRSIATAAAVAAGGINASTRGASVAGLTQHFAAQEAVLNGNLSSIKQQTTPSMKIQFQDHSAETTSATPDVSRPTSTAHNFQPNMIQSQGIYDSSSQAQASMVPSVGHAVNPSLKIDQMNNSSNHGMLNDVRPITGEARIVAPYVSKLSPASAVEVRLQNGREFVAVLCAVDVLKMRATFFHDLLTDQELMYAGRNTSVSSPAVNALHNAMNGNSSSSSSASCVSNSSNSGDSCSSPYHPYHPKHISLHGNQMKMHGAQTIWRDPLVLPEQSPYEAAAFLESLHEGRSLDRGEWNLSWARLAVSWGVDDLVRDYAALVDRHFDRICATIQRHHWRTNPAVLANLRICILRTAAAPIPSIITGIVSETTTAVGYSKVKVAFDLDPTNIHPRNSANHQNGSSPCSSSSSLPPLQAKHLANYNAHELLQAAKRSSNGSSMSISEYERPSNPGNYSPESESRPHPESPSRHMMLTNTLSPTTAVYGDVSEPFFVQALRYPSSSNNGTPGGYSSSIPSSNHGTLGTVWIDPDELFLQESRRLISTTDKRVFWEMIRAVLDHTDLARLCKTPLATPSGLLALLRRPEYRVLWISEAIEYLPKEIAVELIRSAYLPESKQNQHFL